MTDDTLAGKRVVLLLSGGQDSTTCLFWALAAGAAEVHALSVWYGQRHDAELQAAVDVLAVARAHYPQATLRHEQVQLGRVLTGTSPLVSDAVLGQYEHADELPGGVEPTFVPGRNLLFLTLAANRAASLRADAVVTGVCEEDFGGYFDCRRVFVDAAERAVAQAVVGRDEWLPILTPLMRLDKAASVRLAQALPGCMEALGVSHTCYAGSRPPCGRCHACHLRARGFAQAGVADPLLRS
jgi:7-cyano-7-deazaguanine synthase